MQNKPWTVCPETVRIRVQQPEVFKGSSGKIKKTILEERGIFFILLLYYISAE
jgi:hypothetical protein